MIDKETLARKLTWVVILSNSCIVCRMAVSQQALLSKDFYKFKLVYLNPCRLLFKLPKHIRSWEHSILLEQQRSYWHLHLKQAQLFALIPVLSTSVIWQTSSQLTFLELWNSNSNWLLVENALLRRPAHSHSMCLSHTFLFLLQFDSWEWIFFLTTHTILRKYGGCI